MDSKSFQSTDRVSRGSSTNNQLEDFDLFLPERIFDETAGGILFDVPNLQTFDTLEQQHETFYRLQQNLQMGNVGNENLMDAFGGNFTAVDQKFENLVEKTNVRKRQSEISTDVVSSAHSVHSNLTGGQSMMSFGGANQRNSNLHFDDESVEMESRKRSAQSLSEINEADLTESEKLELKKQRRRNQIAKASRLSRARKKKELDYLKDENQKLREERTKFLAKITALQKKVEHMRETGVIDMKTENELLRAQLDQHKRFIACFKHLCEAPVDSPSLDSEVYLANLEGSLGIKRPAEDTKPERPTVLQICSDDTKAAIYKQGSDAAHEQVINLLSQSVADGWHPVIIPDQAQIPYQNFYMSYKYQNDYGQGKSDSWSKHSGRKRLNVRIEMTYNGLNKEAVADYMWSELCETSAHERLYNVKNIEVTQLADDMPDLDTKMLYYREKDKMDIDGNYKDWVVICNKRTRSLPTTMLEHDYEKSSLAARHSKADFVFEKRDCNVLAMSTTQHSLSEKFGLAREGESSTGNRIQSLFIQGAVMYNDKADAKLIVVFSFPDDFHIKAMEGFKDVLLPDGTLSLKFAGVIKESYDMLGEQYGGGM